MNEGILRKYKWIMHWGTRFSSSHSSSASQCSKNQTKTKAKHNTHCTGQATEVLFCPFHLLLVNCRKLLCILSLCFSFLTPNALVQMRALWHVYRVLRKFT